jgi:hypothetical protein
MQNIFAVGLVDLYQKIKKNIPVIPFGCHVNKISAWNQLWKPFTQGSILPSLVKIGPVIFHNQMF